MFEKIRNGMADRRRWRSAKTLDELGRRGAEWARGELGAHPMGYDVPAPETEPLLPVLARLNDAGFFTFGSQPGGRWCFDGVLVEQRAFVEGWLDRSRLDGFRRVMGRSGMLVVDSFADDVELTREDGVTATGGKTRDRVHGMLRGVSHQAVRQLADAAEICAVDMRWCREKTLWRALENWLDQEG